MDQELRSCRAPLERLPVEAIQAIMCALGNIESLKSMVLACSSFYHAHNDAKLLITSQVLLNEVSLDILPEAIAVLESSHMKPWTRRRMQDFIFQHLHIRKASVQSWSVDETLSISQLHSHIQYFAADFALKSLMLQGDITPPSRNEMARIERALYRFQLYCNMFADCNYRVFDLEEQRDLLFSRFSPWENEQFACIHDYLFRAVTPAFDELAEHDVTWGEFRTHYARFSDPEGVEPILARGLASIHSLVLATTYDEWYKLLGLYCPDFDRHFLHQALVEVNEPNDDVYLQDYTTQNNLVRIRSPFFLDPDTGPEDAWRWAHQKETCSRFVNTGSRRPLREWGYVMWDRARLDRIAILQTPWEETEEPLPTEEEIKRDVELKASFDRRSKICMRGGRGWWSFDDESKVVWPAPKASAVGPGKRAKRKEYPHVNSLKEARELILSLKYQ